MYLYDYRHACSDPGILHAIVNKYVAGTCHNEAVRRGQAPS